MVASIVLTCATSLLATQAFPDSCINNSHRSSASFQASILLPPLHTAHFLEYFYPCSGIFQYIPNNLTS